jgi:DNA-binding NtrC family response regulator
MVRILVIDDEDIVRVCCRRTLELDGYEVDIAKSGSEGLEFLKKSTYDLLLIDLKMPGMDGLEMLRDIKKVRPEQRVMIMSGYDTIENVVECISSGAAHYVEKPFTPEMLISRIKEVLE